MVDLFFKLLANLHHKEVFNSCCH